LLIHNILIQSGTFTIAFLAFRNNDSNGHIPSIFNLKYSGLFACVAFHHYAFDHGLPPQPLPLKIAGVAVNTLRITDPHVLQKGAL
jgi:hypothetical protein